MVAAMRRGGAGPKLINNALTLLGQTFDHGIDKGSCRANPVRHVRRPRVERSNEIRYLDQAELEALLRAADSDTDRVLFLTAAMTGLRQGELLGLQWRDIDWLAGKLRVRRSYVRGHWGPPKSRRATRAVPMADRLAGELDRHHKASSYKADDDLVFGHPQRGTVLDHSDLVRRFKRALRTGGVREVRFHDLRHTFGTRMAAAGVPMRTPAGVDGPPRLQDHPHLRRLRAVRPRGGAGGARVRAGIGPQLGPRVGRGRAAHGPPLTRKSRPCGDIVDAPERIRTSTDHTVHKALNLARLPVPPQARGSASIATLESVGTGR